MGGAYSITNVTEIPQFYCAAAFGVYPGGEQGAGTNLFEDQGVRQPKDVFSGQFPKSAACQYKQIQGDLTQSQDCRKFDWHNVLSAAVWDNPGYIEGKWVVEEKPEYGEWSSCQPVAEESSVQEPSCQKHRTVTYYETNTCGNARRVARTTTEYASCECPCTEQWRALDPVVTPLTEWGECVDKNPKPGDLLISTIDPQYTQCPGVKSRSIRTVIEEISSCTQNRRTKSDVTSEETAECTYQCLQAVCHTQNDKWCDPNGTCHNDWWFGRVKKWQCQNVPPGTPGHFPQHFNVNQHDDFFGNAPACGPVGGTSDKCYSITN
jgi:hypothetical protein